MFKPKTYEEILKEMEYSLRSHLAEPVDLSPGSIIMTIISMVAGQVHYLQTQIDNLYALNHIPVNAPTYTYPDGTKSFSRPKDGQTHNIFDLGNPHDFRQFMWDDMMGQWVYTGSSINVKVPQAVSFAPITVALEDLAPKCECGKDKHGFARHSEWCAKWSSEA